MLTLHEKVQHIEFARELAQSFNHTFNTKVFPPPQESLNQDTRRLMSLTEPERKMSKSHPSKNSRILLSDSNREIEKKLKRATTDSLGDVDGSWAEALMRPGVGC
jgi:tryptophanyl-tRNA synthetase